MFTSAAATSSCVDKRIGGRQHQVRAAIMQCAGQVRRLRRHVQARREAQAL